jgi:hypothetical protein
MARNHPRPRVCCRESGGPGGRGGLPGGNAVLTPLHWKAFMGWLRILVAREVYEIPRKREACWSWRS